MESEKVTSSTGDPQGAPIEPNGGNHFMVGSTRTHVSLWKPPEQGEKLTHDMAMNLALWILKQIDPYGTKLDEAKRRA